MVCTISHSWTGKSIPFELAWLITMWFPRRVSLSASQLILHHVTHTFKVVSFGDPVPGGAVRDLAWGRVSRNGSNWGQPSSSCSIAFFSSLSSFSSSALWPRGKGSESAIATGAERALDCLCDFGQIAPSLCGISSSLH